MKALPYEQIKTKYKKVAPGLNEKARRFWAAEEALKLGYGGIAAVSRATKITQRTIRRGIKELSTGICGDMNRQRKKGGGRKSILKKYPGLVSAIDKLIEPNPSGRPNESLRWTCKSTYELSNELQSQGFSVSPTCLRGLLKNMGYSIQRYRKRLGKAKYGVTNMQFKQVAEFSNEFQKRGWPVIFVDAIRKEQHRETALNEHECGGVSYKAHGIRFDFKWSLIDTDDDLKQFVIKSIQSWWKESEKSIYLSAKRILIVAEGGGSNDWRDPLWGKDLQSWVNQKKLTVIVCHFPPGTSKWTKIGHQILYHASLNQGRKTSIGYEVVVKLIGSTTKNERVNKNVRVDYRTKPKGLKKANVQKRKSSIEKYHFRGEWNYKIKPII